MELDRRAWRAKEAEKRKAEAAKKRSEKEKEQRTKVQLASQRMCDKFGYKSSQMHLGVFLNKPGLVRNGDDLKENLGIGILDGDDEDFGDSDMDDETLLGVLDGTSEGTVRASALQCAAAQSQDTTVSTTIATASQKSTKFAQISTTDDFASFFDDFGSSTQIARELDAVEPAEQMPITQSVTLVATVTADDFDDFDLTAEDLEELDPSPSKENKALEDRKLMPPPPLPSKRASPSIPLDTGFTISELEQFVDDELQLTQADPG